MVDWRSFNMRSSVSVILGWLAEISMSHYRHDRNLDFDGNICTRQGAFGYDKVR